MVRRTGAAAGLAVVLAATGPVAAQSVDYLASSPSPGPDSPSRVAGAWSLLARATPGLETQMDVSLTAGQSPDGLIWPGAAVAQDRPWRDVGLGVATRWAPSDRARLELRFDGRLRTLPLVGASVGDLESPQNDRNEQSAQLTAALTPARALDLKLSGRILSATDAISDADAGSRMELKSHGGQVESTLRWAASPVLAFEAGARLDATEVTWREQASAAQSYAAIQPRVAAVVTPWAAAEWRVGFERAVTPLDSSRFVTLARITDFAGGTRLDPDSEWRLQGVLTQGLPAAGRLRLTLVDAAIERATELTRVGAAGVEGPGNTPGGARQEIDLAMTLPLASIGLPGLSLETAGGCRRSQVQDPLTGLMRRPSGEAPYDGRLSLAQTLPERGLKWGLDARAVGPQSYYGLSQTSSGEADQTLGAFVEYRPNNLLLRLSVDNLTGDTRRWSDSVYQGDRELGALSHILRRDDGGPGFSFSLRRPL